MLLYILNQHYRLVGSADFLMSANNYIDTLTQQVYNNANNKMTQGGLMIKTLEDALKRISELEEENSLLRVELEDLRSKKAAGRKKHDSAWTASYNDFVVKYESGMTIMEIVDQSDISRRTAYRYKAYYDEVNKIKQQAD